MALQRWPHHQGLDCEICTDIVQLMEAMLTMLSSRTHTAHDIDASCEICYQYSLLYDMMLKLVELMAPAEEVRIPARDPSKMKDFQQGGRSTCLIYNKEVVLYE